MTTDDERRERAIKVLAIRGITLYESLLAGDVLALVDENRQLREWHDATVPIIAAIAIYGERVNVAAIAAKAQALNEASKEAL